MTPPRNSDIERPTGPGTDVEHASGGDARAGGVEDAPAAASGDVERVDAPDAERAADLDAVEGTGGGDHLPTSADL